MKQYHYIRIYIFFITLLFPIYGLHAQKYNFTNYTVENGLSQSQVLAVCQDNDGVMWFGTNGGGITKFDGRNYEYLTDKDGLADNVVFSIVKDNKGRMLIGTNNGLSIYEANQFKNYTTANGLTHNRVYKVFVDNTNRILLGTGKGVSLLKDTLCYHYSTASTLDSALAVDIYQDSDNNLWFSTLGNGVYKHNSNLIKHYGIKEGLKNEYAFSVIEKEKGIYWFCINEELYELKNEKINKIVVPNLPTKTTFYSILKDNNSVFWLGTENGVLKYQSGNFKKYNVDNGLINNNVWRLFQDREHNLWFASKVNGISKLASERFFVYSKENGLVNNTSTAIFQSKDNGYWIGSKNGLDFLSKNGIIHYNLEKLGVNNHVKALNQDKKGNIFIGTSYGVLKFKNGRFKSIENTQKQNLNYIYDIYINSEDEILLGTKSGLAQIIDDEIVESKKYNFNKDAVLKICEHEQTVYFVTSKIVFKISNNKAEEVKCFGDISSLQIFNIASDGFQNLIIGTSSGIYLYRNKKTEHLTEKNGLYSKDIYSLLLDSTGNIIVGLKNGIDQINLLSDGKYKITHYGSDDGFTGGEAIFNSIYIDNQNHIWFGAEKGLMVYQPEYDRVNELEPITRIKNIQLFGQKTDWKLFADSVDINNIPDGLELAYDRNYLTFNFIGVSHTAPAKVRYKYMLKGLDKDWSEETKETEKSYTSLPPGDYEFLVMATNGDGVWNKIPASFKFTILPPFWRTWWFYSIIAGLICMAIYSYTKIRIANNKILKQSHTIEEKNEALNQANVLIAGKNKNITDSINYALRIQQSFLTSERVMKKALNDYFILYKPRDIVSGDFYWVFDLPDRTLVVAADSTGHGIPGAFMSLIGLSLLNEISHSKKITEPAKILEELRRVIICALNPDMVDEGGKDGMDLALISIDKHRSDDKGIKITYSGGNNAIYVVCFDENNQKQLVEYKPDKQPVGYYSNMKPFTQQDFYVQKGTIIYMGTDGFADQFGGPNGKKIMTKQLKATLLDIAHEPMAEQHQKLDDYFNNWKGDLEQVDDVTVFGIKIS